jgi:hypothetical protein
MRKERKIKRKKGLMVRLGREEEFWGKGRSGEGRKWRRS